MTSELNEIVKSYLVKYKNEKEFLQYNDIEPKEFKKWVKDGYSEDGFFEVMNCYYLAGDATNGEYMKITSIDEIVKLLLCEIEESDFLEIIETLSDDNPDDPINPNNTAEVLETFCEFMQEIAVFPIEHGKYKGGLMLMLNEY